MMQVTRKTACHGLLTLVCLFPIFYIARVHTWTRQRIIEELHHWTPRGSMPRVQAWGFMGSCMRGTGVALYDYADYAETLLKLPRPVFFCVNGGAIGDEDKFRKRFGADRIVSLKSWPQDLRPSFLKKKNNALDRLIQPYNLSHIYMLKGGWPDQVVSYHAVNLVHTIFDGRFPHGDRCAKVGPEVPGGIPVVPHMIRTWPQHGDNLGGELGIPAETTVICRYGGHDTFNIRYAKEAVVAAVLERKDLLFLFVNTDVFANSTAGIYFLPSVQSDEEKATFIRTCDAMIHARREGETFGLAIAEFAMMGRRVITERVSPEALHLVELKEHAVLYHDYKSLLHVLLHFNRSAHLDPAWNGYSKYAPDKVMDRFWEIFLSST